MSLSIRSLSVPAFPTPRMTSSARDRVLKPRRRARPELTALEDRRVLSTLTGFSYAEQAAFPGPQTAILSMPTAFRDSIDQSWQAIASGQKQIGGQTLSQLVTVGIQNAAKAQGVSAYNISESFATHGDYAATLDTSGSSPVLRIQYRLAGNSFDFTNTTNSSAGSWADPTFHVTYDLTVNINLTFSSDLTVANPVSAAASAQVGNVAVSSKNVLVAVAGAFGNDITGKIANGLNGHTIDLSSMISTGPLNAAFGVEAGKGFTHLHASVDAGGNLVLTALSPDLVIQGGANDQIGLATRPDGSLQVSELGQSATFDSGYLRSITVVTGTGASTVRVAGSPAGVPVTIRDGAGSGSSDLVTIGNGGSLAAIGGPVNVNSSNASGHTSVTVDDSLDAADRSATITRGAVQFSGLPAVNYSGPGMAGVSVLGGTGNDSFAITSTAAGIPVSLLAGAGHSAVSVGDHGSLAGIAGAVNVIQRRGIRNDLGTFPTDLVIDDSGESGRNATLTDGTVSFDGVAPINYYGLATLKVVGANGNNAIRVASTTAGLPVSIYNSQHNTVTLPPGTTTVTTYVGLPISSILRNSTGYFASIN